MGLKKEYEKYKLDKEQKDKELYAYNSKVKEIQQKVINYLAGLDLVKLASVGVDIDIDVNQLGNPQYCKEKLNELAGQRDKLEQLGLELLA